MASIVNKRRESMYFRAVAQIVSEKITNANISATTVTAVKLSNDGSVLTVYVTFESNKERSLENLMKTSGFVRSELSRLGNQRIVPRVVFKYDDTQESALRIEEILRQIKKGK